MTFKGEGAWAAKKGGKIRGHQCTRIQKRGGPTWDNKEGDNGAIGEP
jgi:hypothetical protein